MAIVWKYKLLSDYSRRLYAIDIVLILCSIHTMQLLLLFVIYTIIGIDFRLHKVVLAYNPLEYFE